MVCAMLVVAAKQEVSYNRAEVPFMRCAVCEQLVIQLATQRDTYKDTLGSKTKEKKTQFASSYSKYSEQLLVDLVETSCDPTEDHGAWLTALDAEEVQVGLKRRVKLTRQEGPAACKRECRTIARACTEVLTDYEFEVVELLWAGRSASALQESLCQHMGGWCGARAKRLPKPPKKPMGAEVFQLMTAQERQMAEMMKSMKGMPGAEGLQLMDRNAMEGMDAASASPPPMPPPLGAMGRGMLAVRETWASFASWLGGAFGVGGEL